MRLTPVLAVLLPLGLTLASTALPMAAHALPAEGEGRRLFMKYNCYSCHGMYAGGGMGPNLRGQGGEGGEAGDVREAVLQGEDHGMRSFKTYFTSTDVDNMVAYIKSLGTKNEPTFKDWWVAVPPK